MHIYYTYATYNIHIYIMSYINILKKINANRCSLPCPSFDWNQSNDWQIFKRYLKNFSLALYNIDYDLHDEIYVFDWKNKLKADKCINNLCHCILSCNVKELLTLYAISNIGKFLIQYSSLIKMYARHCQMRFGFWYQDRISVWKAEIFASNSEQRYVYRYRYIEDVVKTKD